MAGIDWRLSGIELATCNCSSAGRPCQFNALPTRGDCRAAEAAPDQPGALRPCAGRRRGVRRPLRLAQGHPRGPRRGHADRRRAGERGPAPRGPGHLPRRGDGAGGHHLQRLLQRHRHLPRAPVLPDRGRARPGAPDRTLRGAGPGRGPRRADPQPDDGSGAPRQGHAARHGFEYHEAEYASSSTRTSAGPIELDWQGRHAHFARLEWTRNGPVHA